MNKELKFLIYNTPEEDVAINAVVKDETIWLTQKAMAELFAVGVPAISKHLKNIFAEGELEEIVVVSILEITTTAFVSEQIKKTRQFNIKQLLFPKWKQLLTRDSILDCGRERENPRPPGLTGTALQQGIRCSEQPHCK